MNQQEQKQPNPENIHKMPIERNKLDFEFVWRIYTIYEGVNVRSATDGFAEHDAQKNKANQNMQHVNA